MPRQSRPQRTTKPTGTGRAWLALTVAEFVDSDLDDLVRRLLQRADAGALTNRPQQTMAWHESFAALQEAVAVVAGEFVMQGILVEFPLLRLKRRIGCEAYTGHGLAMAA